MDFNSKTFLYMDISEAIHLSLYEMKRNKFLYLYNLSQKRRAGDVTLKTFVDSIAGRQIVLVALGQSALETLAGRKESEIPGDLAVQCIDEVMRALSFSSKLDWQTCVKERWVNPPEKESLSEAKDIDDNRGENVVYGIEEALKVSEMTNELMEGTRNAAMEILGSVSILDWERMRSLVSWIIDIASMKQNTRGQTDTEHGMQHVSEPDQLPVSVIGDVEFTDSLPKDLEELVDQKVGEANVDASLIVAEELRMGSSE